MRYFKDHPNLRKYLNPPTFEQIEIVVNASRVSLSQFERYYGMYGRFLTHIQRGERKLSPKYWHIIYESLKCIEAGKPLPNFKPMPPNKKRAVVVKKIGVIGELL